MKLNYDAENGLWLLNGWEFEKRGGGSYINYWTATKENIWFWGKNRKEVMQFAKMIDEGKKIPEINQHAIY